MGVRRDLSGLSLSCTIPTEIGLLTALTNLDLGDNKLTGPLPTELGLLTKVLDLVAGGQCLSGTVPTELGAMASVTNMCVPPNSAPQRTANCRVVFVR
jgi:hypothetical protein